MIAGSRPGSRVTARILAGCLIGATFLVPGTGSVAQSPGASASPASLSPAPVGSAAPITSAAPLAAPVLDDATATGMALVTQYTDLVMARDPDALAGFLAPGFQILRANGDHYTREAYLAQGLPDILEYQIGEVSAAQTGGTLVVVWQLTATQLVDGVEQPAGPAPRMSTFAWVDGRWQLAGHANFGSVNR